MRHFAITLAALALASAPAAAQEISMRPGELAEALKGVTVDPKGTLAIKGGADIRDLLTIRDLSTKPTTLDLSGADIDEYAFSKPAYIGRSHFSKRALPPYIFFKAPYSRIILPKGLTSIDAGAFAGSSIQSIVIPEGVTSIGEYAFYNCVNLESIELPSTLSHIGKGAFAGCPNLIEVDLTATAVTEIPERCFSDASSLAFLRLPAALESVGSEAFSGTMLNEIVLPKVKVLAPFALAGMPHLESVTLNKDAQFNEGTLMNNGRLQRVSGVPANLPPLFAANCYTMVPSDILDSASTVGDYAFSNATVSELILAPSVTYIGEGAFSGLNALEKVDAESLGNDIPEADKRAFDGLDTGNILLLVDNDALDAWRAHPVWGLFNVHSEATVKVDEVVSEADSAITLRMSGRTLVVEAPEAITTGAVFTIDGKTVALIPSGGTRAEVQLDGVAEKVIVVNVRTAASQKTAKIML